MIVIASADSNPALKRFKKFYLVTALDGKEKNYLTYNHGYTFMATRAETAMRFLLLRDATKQAQLMAKACPKLSGFQAVEAHEI